MDSFSAYSVKEREAFPQVKPVRMLRRMKRKFSKFLMIGGAMALLISPDPFSDVLALGLLGKAGILVNFKVLAGKRKKVFKGDPLGM